MAQSMSLACERITDDGLLRIFDFGRTQPRGARRNLRERFSKQQEHQLIEAVVREVEDGTIYRGDVTCGEIEITGIKTIVANRFYLDIEYEVLFPSRHGEPTPGIYHALRWTAGIENGAGVIAMTRDQQIVLSRTFRHAARGWRLEIPRGLKKPGETLQESAFREALEEAGIMSTADTQVIDLGVLEPDTGILMQAPRVFALTNVEVDSEQISPDVSEALSGYVTRSVAELKRLILSNEIKDGWTDSAFLRAALHGIINL